jgi:hypothetical protein
MFVLDPELRHSSPEGNKLCSDGAIGRRDLCDIEWLDHDYSIGNPELGSHVCESECSLTQGLAITVTPPRNAANATK